MKCDERPDGCANCQRLGLDCIGLSSASPSSASGSDGNSQAFPVMARLMRTKRTYRSCGSCRVSKTKCDGQRPKCFRCRARSTQCVYSTGPEPRWALGLSRPSDPPPQESQATAREEPEDPETPQPHDGAAIGPPTTVNEQEDAGRHPVPLLLSLSTFGRRNDNSATSPPARELASSSSLSW